MNKDGQLVTGKTENGEVVAAKFRSAPLPTAQEMKEYDEAVPGLAEVIIREFQKQGSHRRTIEKMIVFGQLYFGPLLALAVVLVGFYAGYQLLADGKQLTGLSVSLVPLAGLGTLFVWNTLKREAENDETEQ